MPKALKAHSGGDFIVTIIETIINHIDYRYDQVILSYELVQMLLLQLKLLFSVSNNLIRCSECICGYLLLSYSICSANKCYFY